MFVLLKSRSSSRAVHHCQDDDDDRKECRNQLQMIDAATSPVSLTVWTKSLVFSCTGFTVIGSDGSLVYRVDNYTGRPHQILLMDGSGNPIFTICRRPKKLIRLMMDNQWVVYEGEVSSNTINSTTSSRDKKPVFCVTKDTGMAMRGRRREASIGSILAHMYTMGNRMAIAEKKALHVYTIEGSYRERCCKILDGKRRVVAEINVKEGLRGGVSFGLEVFRLVVMPGFDSKYAMAVVLLLHQMFS